MRREVTRTVWIVRNVALGRRSCVESKKRTGKNLYDSVELIKGVNPPKEMHLQAATGNVSLPALRSGDP